jgi:hypothetical protein
MHCHIAFHASGGLALQIMERQSDANNMWPWGSKPIKVAQDLCDKWHEWVKEASPTCDTRDKWYQDDSGI